MPRLTSHRTQDYAGYRTVLEFWVEERGYEGLFVRSDGDLYKIKKHATVDAEVIGINKRKKFAEKQVTSLKVAFMDKEGRLIELGNVASGIDYPLRSLVSFLGKSCLSPSLVSFPAF